jgi:ABC-type cobalamin/Fe3+-siderophores transport system ATPase subunit
MIKIVNNKDLTPYSFILVPEPKVLLLDEPANNLDLKNQMEVMKIIRDISRTRNISSIVVMHDLNLTLRFSDKFIMLKDGKIFSEGDSKGINSRNIREVYDVNASVDHYNGIPIVVLV